MRRRGGHQDGEPERSPSAAVVRIQAVQGVGGRNRHPEDPAFRCGKVVQRAGHGSAGSVARGSVQVSVMEWGEGSWFGQ